jgi:hypothetical protein
MAAIEITRKDLTARELRAASAKRARRKGGPPDAGDRAGS